MALGIAAALRSGMAPNPLSVALWGYAPEDAAQLVRYIIDECADAGIQLGELRADPAIVHQFSGSSHRDVPVNPDADLNGQVQIHRAGIIRDRL